MAIEPASGPERDPYLLAQVRESFARVAYSHKAHEKQADAYSTWHRRQQWTLVVLTAAGSGTFLFALMGFVADREVADLVTSFVALLVAAASLASKTFDFSERSDAHRDTAAALWDLRESYLSLIADLMAEVVTDDDARTRRAELQEASRVIYAEAPRTTARSFAKARAALKEQEELTFTAAEIDHLLPTALRLEEGEKPA